MLEPGGILRSYGHYGEDGTFGYMYWCPGCKHAHGVAVRACPNHPGPVWGWNGSTERPTFTPSILVFQGGYTKQDGTAVPRETLCHVFVTDGKIQFLGDCAHELKGQTIPIPPWPERD